MSTSVLVTGAAGYVGSHLVNQLLAQGHRVRAAVRTPQRADDVRQTAAGDVEFAYADLTSDDGWADTVAGTDVVMHVASPFPAQNPRADDEVIVPARDGALRVLRHARDAGCRRVVMTSSFAAVGYSPSTEQRWTEQDWTDPADENTAYIRSKAIAERAAWDFMTREGDALELTTIVPVGIFGPTLGPHLSTSVQIVRSMLAGDPLPAGQYFGVVDVRDVADAHVRAMTTEAAAGERFLVVADEPAVTFGELARMVGVSTEDNTTGTRPQISNAKAKAVLGWRPRPLDETIRDTVTSLRDLGLA
ncbi:NAD-dependent epimerase/dehydratase family protein [Mycolicibacterium obuense]|uniref:UDP-glucose 4-epimerase n=1 Tax=Mycolicibacterium obuense TaxID=1807 RepID=A0A0J6VE12_9MYCO|nr:NAD-dependent epimerase/dehydratase family protein [Mycolicibacterium obuense]KMO69225.1 UDP-glucose 4-epimerase [Mycolicibacterium obuense]